jgi:hypothetical protein
MLEQIAVLLLVGSALFARNVSHIRRADKREKWILGAFLLPILYLSAMYITDSDWVNLHDLANESIGLVARMIVGWLESHP